MLVSWSTQPAKTMSTRADIKSPPPNPPKNMPRIMTPSRIRVAALSMPPRKVKSFLLMRTKPVRPPNPRPVSMNASRRMFCPGKKVSAIQNRGAVMIPCSTMVNPKAT